ncbi:hypothetical protein OAP73_04025 [Methylophilaceae bacterium]|nr:hypothetical protein [Methylophilaceae bacterium]
MDNKYGLGSSKVAVEIQKKDQGLECKSCKASNLHFCPTMEDHKCESCGEWQNDIPLNYSTGRSADY